MNSRNGCRSIYATDIVYHTKKKKSIGRDEKMRRKRFCRIGSLLLAALLLLTVLAVPVIAEDPAGSADGSQQTGYAVSGFDNIKTTGSNLRGSFQYTTGVTGAQLQLSGYLVTLQPDTWYYLKYTESVVMTGTAAISYVFYKQGKEVFSYLSSTRSELLFYTGTGSGACQLLLQGSKSDIGINKYSLYQVASFDMSYDVRYTSFDEDHAELFPEIDLEKYKGVTGDFIELITIYEDIEIAEDYTWDGQVYLYLFNASGKQVTGGTLTCPDDDGNRTSFSMVPVVSGNPFGETVDWHFLKLEVTGHWWHQYLKNADGTPNIHSRKREITDLTLTYWDKTSKTFPYNGEIKIEDTLEDGKVTGSAVTGDFESEVNLEINYTYYRTDTSPNGAYYHNQVDSIYFNVPNYLKEAYGKLVDVKLSYRRARTKPIIVTDNEALYHDLLANIGVPVSSYDSTKPTLSHLKSQESNKLIYDFTYNKNLGTPAGSHVTLTSEQDCDRLLYAFLVDDVHAGVREAGSTVPRQELVDWLYSYTQKYYPDSFVGPILAYQGANGRILGDLFSEADEEDLQNCFRKSELTDSTMYLVRFNVSQYREIPLSAELNGVWYDTNDSEPAYMAEQDIYLNLHVLELTYENEVGVRTVVPVSSNHIDAVADVTTEKTPDQIAQQTGQELAVNLGSFWQSLLDQLGTFGKILGLILGIVVLVLIVVFVVPVVSPIFKAIFGAIGRFFRWIRDKIRGASAKRKQRKNSRK